MHPDLSNIQATLYSLDLAYVVQTNNRTYLLNPLIQLLIC